jgi:hypothetical protein
LFRLGTELLIIIVLLLFAVLYIDTASIISNLTISPTQQFVHKDDLSRSDKVGEATNYSTPQDILILEKVASETNHSIYKLASVYFLIGLLGVIFGGSGVFLAIAIPYLYEKWKQPHLEIRIPENDPSGKNRRYMSCTTHEYLPIERNAAIDTNIELRFYDAHGTPLFGEKPIVAKWSNKPRCLTLGQFDDTKVPDAHRQNVLSGTRGEPFDVVIKNLGNENCYGFNGWSYEFTPTEENRLYEILEGTFKVRLRRFQMYMDPKKENFF